MARVTFTPNLERHLSHPPLEVGAHNVRDALDAVFVHNPALRRHVLDHQGRLLQHVMIFVDGSAVTDRVGLSDLVGESAEIFVLHVLAGADLPN